MFLNNIPICLEGPLNCICTQISINVYVFIQKSMYHIQNHVQISNQNCSFQDKFSFFFLFIMFCLGSLEYIKVVLLIRLSYKKTCKFYFQRKSKYFSCKQNCDVCFWFICANWRQKQNFKILYCSLNNMNGTGRITFRSQELQLLS